MRAYSMDLRERALRDSDVGMKAADVAARYHVSGSWVRLLKQRRRETGEVAPRRQRYGPRRKLAVQRSGQVFSTVSFQGACMISAGVPSAPIECYSGPVAGAVTSTSIDTATATTDSAGRFLLTTNTPKANFGGCTPYTLTITAAGHPTYSVTGPHGTGGGRQLFSLSPPTPSFVGNCQG